MNQINISIGRRRKAMAKVLISRGKDYNPTDYVNGLAKRGSSPGSM